MKSNKDSTLLREYIRESLLTEDSMTSIASTAGRAFGRGVQKAGLGKGGAGREAIKGKLKKLGKSIKHSAKTILSGAGEFLSLGLFKADFDKIHQEYLDDLKKIEDKYGSAFKRVNADFADASSPINAILWLTNPGAMLLGATVKGLPEKIARKIEKDALTSGASQKFKEKIDAHFGKIKADIEKAKASTPFETRPSQRGRQQPEKSSQLEKIVDDLKMKKSEFTQQVKKASANTPEAMKAAETLIKRYDELIRLAQS